MSNLKKNKTYNVLVTWISMINYLKQNKNSKKYKKIKFKYLYRKQATNEKTLVQLIKNIDGLICGDDEVTEKVLNKANKLKVISKWGTGIDSIDLKNCKKKRIKVLNTANAFSEGVSQLTMAFIFDFSRKLVQTNSQIKKNNWPKNSGFLIKNKVIGIIGFGNVGKSIGLIAKKNGMKVIFNDVKKINSNFKQVSKDKLLNLSDVVVTACNLNKTSNKLIKYGEFKKMKNSAAIINISRGQVIDEISLVKALRNKQISYAGIDVFEKEPIKKNNPLLKFDNCTLSSHNAFNTIENVNKVNINTLKNLIKILN